MFQAGPWLILIVVVAVLFIIAFFRSIYSIGPTQIGVVRKRFGAKLPGNNPVAFKGEAGYQAELLMPGLRFKFVLIYAVTKHMWVQVPAVDRLVTCQNMTIEQLGLEFQGFAGGIIYRTVTDDTGLKGSYNFTLSFSSISSMQRFQAGAAAAPDGGQAAGDPGGVITLYDAVRNQLGLKLEKQTRPLPVLVIDHIEEQPTAN